MAYRLRIQMKDGSSINTCYQNEDYALNMYGLALFKKLAKRAEIYDTDENCTILAFDETTGEKRP